MWGTSRGASCVRVSLARNCAQTLQDISKRIKCGSLNAISETRCKEHRTTRRGVDNQKPCARVSDAPTQYPELRVRRPAALPGWRLGSQRHRTPIRAPGVTPGQGGRRAECKNQDEASRVTLLPVVTDFRGTFTFHTNQSNAADVFLQGSHLSTCM